MQERYAPSGLKGAAWQPFLLDYSGDVDATMSAGIKETRGESYSLARSATHGV